MQPSLDDFQLRIERILHKLADLQARQGNQREKENHGFRLGPPLEEAALLSFEQKSGITLPEEFRRFLLQAGDGGAGPGYGLASSRKWWEWAAQSETHHGAGYLTLPCPIVPGMAKRTLGQAPANPDWDVLLQGTLTLNDDYPDSIVLIVSGDHRGRMVHLDYESDDGPYMTRDADFLDWYERWLDTLLWGWNASCFGPGMPGDAARMLEVLRHTESSPDDRREALRSVLRMPALAPEMAPLAIAALQFPSAPVREVAARVAGQHKLQAAAAPLAQLLQDPHPDVRLASVRAMQSIQSPGWTETVRSVLGDSEPDVVDAAIYALIDARALTPENLRPLILSATSEKRRIGLYAWRKSRFSLAGETWMEARMTDEDSMVRYELARTAAHAKVPGLQEMIRTMKANHPEDACFLKPLESMGISEVTKNTLGCLHAAWKTLFVVGAYLKHRLRTIYRR